MTKFIFFLLAIFPLSVFPQTADSLSNNQDIITRQIEDLDEVSEDSDVLESLDQILTDPVNINSATIDQLQQIPGVDAIIAQDIVLYRLNVAPFKTVADLKNIPTVSIQLYQNIIPFITVVGSAEKNVEQKTNTASYFTGTIRIRLQSDIQDRVGFTDEKFDGGKYKNYVQQKYQVGDGLKFGFINEKDPGESQYFDYVNGYLEYRKDEWFDNWYGFKVIGGSYKASYGQGLVQWSNTGFGKSSEPVFSVKKVGRGIQPYLSADENNFYNGIALSNKLIRTDTKLDFFYSSRNYDGKFNNRLIYKDGVSELSEFVTLDFSGLHRDSTELSKKDNIRINTFGTDVTQLLLGYGKIGFTFVQVETQKHNSNDASSDSSPEKVNALNSELQPGISKQAMSVNWDLVFSTYNFYGEMAADNNKSYAALIGVIYKPFSQLAYTANYRFFDRDFYSLYAKPFKEKTSQTNNETGFYQGITFTVNKLTLYSYFDYYEFGHSTFATIFPSHGNDWLVGFDFQLTPKYSITLQGKTEKSSTDFRVSDEWLREITTESDVTAKSVKFIFNARLSNEFSTQSKVNYRSYLSDQTETTDGYAFSQAVKYSIRDFTLNGYYHSFDVNTFDNRIYVFESDLPGLVSSGLLYDKGFRFAIVIKKSVFDRFDLSGKISHTQYAGKQVISSGTGAIDGNQLTQIGFQLDLRL